MTTKPEVTLRWNDLEERRSKWLNIVGRFKPGLTHPQGQAAIDALWRSIRAEELKQIGRTSQRFRDAFRSEEHTSELQSRGHLVCRLLLEKKKKKATINSQTQS